MSRAHTLRVADYLQHILEAVANIQDYTVGMDFAAFMADRKTRDAVIRNLEVIGEAVWQTIQQDLPLLRRQISALA